MNNYKITKMASGYWRVTDKRTSSQLFEVFEAYDHRGAAPEYIVIMKATDAVFRFDKLVQVANLARALTPTLSDSSATQLDWV